jgi:hypothetical protein
VKASPVDIFERLRQGMAFVLELYQTREGFFDDPA